MKQKFAPMYLAGLLLLLASLACQAVSGGGSDATAAPGTTDVPAPTEPVVLQPALPDPLSPSGAGIACFGLQDGGLSCLDESGWKTYNTENSTLPTNYLADGTLCPDGRLAIAHYDGISLFDGKAWEHIAKTDAYSTAEAIACAADGSIWIGHFKGISRYKAGNWQTYPSAELATGDSANELVYDIAVGAENQVWAVTSRSVVQFNDGKWNIFQKGQGFEDDMFFNAITIDTKGRPWAGYSNGAAVYEDNTWKLVKKNSYDSPKGMGFDSKGRLWLTTLSAGVTVFNGSTWASYDRSTKDLPTNHTNALATDSLGRVWVATTYGLAVLDGKTWQTYRIENSDLGDNNIKFIVVAKDGPSLPAPAEKEKASLTGALEDADKKPMAGMRVEICVETLISSYKGETPCSDQPFVMSTKTDEKGVFTFENVPAGYYVIVAETGTSWAQLTDKFGISSERTLLTAGEKHDIGTLTLEKDK